MKCIQKSVPFLQGLPDSPARWGRSCFQLSSLNWGQLGQGGAFYSTFKSPSWHCCFGIAGVYTREMFFSSKCWVRATSGPVSVWGWGACSGGCLGGCHFPPFLPVCQAAAGATEQASVGFQPWVPYLVVHAAVPGLVVYAVPCWCLSKLRMEPPLPLAAILWLSEPSEWLLRDCCCSGLVQLRKSWGRIEKS